MLWVWLVLLYGVLKGCREICKKKALETCSSIEVLLIYSLVSFALVCPDAPRAMGLAPKYYFYIAIKSFVIFVAWICGFKAIKRLPISFYGVLDLSRVLFSTMLGVFVLHEVMSTYNIIGLLLVCVGLLMLKFRPDVFLQRIRKTAAAAKQMGAEPEGTGQLKTTGTQENISLPVVLMALISCLLNAVSGLMDKILMKDMNSSQLQFWYMLFLCLFYIIYAIIVHEKIDLKKTLKNKWVWILSIMFVIADRALFVANSMEASQVTVMTLLKQAGCIVTILAGRFVFKEKNTGYKLVCAVVIIAGIVLSVM